jgi:hypothetical protein
MHQIEMPLDRILGAMIYTLKERVNPEIGNLIS